MQVPKRVIIKISCKGLKSGTSPCLTKDPKQDFMIKVPDSGGCNNNLKDKCMPDSQNLPRKKMRQQTESCVADDSERDVKVKAPISCGSIKRKADTVLNAQRLMRRKMDHGRTDNSESDMKVKVPAAGDCNKRKPVSMLDSERLKRKQMDRGVKLKCNLILKELSMHRFGWVFSVPVDPVACNIPDYFDVISNPMDFGTIRSKLENNKYSYAEEFASDVYLTFSNAMEYNPPHDNVHSWAKSLDVMFRNKWKVLVRKWNHESSGVEPGGIRQNESLRYGKDEKNASSEQPSLNSTKEVKQSMTWEEKTRLWKQLLSMINGKMPEKLRSTLKNSKLTGLIDRKNNVGINDIEDSTWLELRRYIKAAMVVAEKTTNTGRSKSFRDQRPETKVDAGRKDVSVHATTSNQDIAKKVLRTQAKSSNLGVPSSDSNVVRKDLPAPAISSISNAATKNVTAPATYSNLYVAKDGLPAHATTSNQDSDGWTRLDDQSSLEKAQRAAMLRTRFADTILKAKAISDPKRLQDEKKRLERLQREEEAKIKSLLEEQQLQVRKQIEKARQDSMSALETMERRSMIVCNSTSLRELERLCGVPPPVGDKEYNLYADSLRRHLRLIGLVLKVDDFVEDEDAFLYGDREEGEI